MQADHPPALFLPKKIIFIAVTASVLFEHERAQDLRQEVSSEWISAAKATRPNVSNP